MTNRQALQLLFVAHGISGAAQGISMLSIPWFFAQSSRSTDFNLYYAFTTLLSFFWSIWAGNLVDRFSRKGVFLATNIVQGIIVGGIAVWGFYTQNLSDWAIVTVFAITVSGFSIHYPNLYAFSQEITESENYTKVTSTIEVVGQTTNIASGVLGAFLLEGIDYQGIVIEKWSIWEIFGLDALTYFISIVLIFFIRYTPLKEREITKNSFFGQIQIGLAFLKKHPKILVFGIFSYSVFVVMLVNIHALVPIYVKNHLKATGFAFGAAKMITAIGSLLAGTASERLFNKISKHRSIIVFNLLAAVAIFCLVFSQNLYIFLFASFILGYSNAGARIFRLSYIFDHVPNALIGRTNSVFSVVGILARVSLIYLVSLPFFSQESNILYAYASIGVVVLVSAWVLKKNI